MEPPRYKAVEFALLILVGPSEVELVRLEKLLRSVFRFGRSVREVVLVDNTTDGRQLEKRFVVPEGVVLTSLVHERRGQGQDSLGAGCWGILQGLRYVVSQGKVRPVIKMDTDALVIGPFAERLEQLLQKNPLLGTAGVVEWNCDDSPRSWEPFGEIMERLTRRVEWRKYVLLNRRIALFGRWALYRRLILAARRQGYRWGEHPQGGAYLVSAELIRRMHSRGDLLHGPAWHPLYMGEDVLMGLYAVICGLQNVHAGRAGEVFGIAHQGLPLPPEELLRRDYAFVHSLKNHAGILEEDLYTFFENACSHSSERIAAQTSPD